MLPLARMDVGHIFPDLRLSDIGTGLLRTVGILSALGDGDAEALCRGAKSLGWTTIVVDARARCATPRARSERRRAPRRWPDEAITHLRPDDGTAIVVLTHDDQFDLPVLQPHWRATPSSLGARSRRNQERRREGLVEAGLTEDALDRISGPVGLDIGAESPAETALSTLAEILAVRAGRKGGPLRRRPADPPDAAAGKK